MLEGVEKARKMLSSVNDAQVSIDYLLNEEDLVRTLKRDEFEALIQPSLVCLTDLIQECIDGAALKPDQIHSIELFGDATRTPII